MSIVVNNLSFAFNKTGKTIFNSLSFETSCRSIAIVGPSGCGKSTFLRIICGLIKKSSGNILCGNISVDNTSPSQMIQTNSVGFMFQEDTLLPYLSVIDNIKLPLLLQKRALTDVSQYVEKVGLSTDVDKYPRELSGGMRTRVALARTLITHPAILLLDEPFTGLDEYWRNTLYRELETLRSEINPFTALVTHHIEEALLLSNFIIVLGKNGNILKEISISKKLPRVFNEDPMDGLRGIQREIQTLIIEDSNEK